MLWFESSNSYVVLSEVAYQLLTYYFKSPDQQAYIQNLQELLHCSSQEAEVYYSELNQFLSDVNSKDLTEIVTSQPKSIPKGSIIKYYDFGDTLIGINFSSDTLVQLIHPYLQHNSIVNCPDAHVQFDIFNDDEKLYLFKNNSFIGCYETDHFHFLQGKFAMELVSSIYHTVESDWMATFHASTICNDKEAIMMIGDSGNGKSTLSAVLMAHGYDLLADDFTPMLAENQHLYRFPAAISIKPGAFSMIEQLFDGFSQSDLQMSTSKSTMVKYLPPSRSFNSARKNFPCRKLVMVNYKKDATSEMNLCSPEKMLQTFIPDSWISPQPEHSKLFLDWLKELQFYELSYSNNEFAVKKFKELFELS